MADINNELSSAADDANEEEEEEEGEGEGEGEGGREGGVPVSSMLGPVRD